MNLFQMVPHWLFGLLGIGLCVVISQKMQGKAIGAFKGHLPNALQ